MRQETFTPLEHAAGVVVVIALSMLLHVGLSTGHGFMSASWDAMAFADGPDPTIAAPNSADWGNAVLRLSGMH
ncbi:hypothetical protein F1188_02165 [Roseospira marina]|uniref:Uncharacterized protein n=1 Tax=Roseospira marina TaxID=140057 RepID=A0A5M6IHZ6_9PROT|nr:hypothetical protein [Roseospira marina]KAA5607587.1 hypothetical protein F1188_02165 [Roseospira marina]MBB4312221.1 hypothetical protein [Roseospira marina]MBB5085763.1 hypothetical protein [Roseospira marina]